jgi:hypothetical protein
MGIVMLALLLQAEAAEKKTALLVAARCQSKEDGNDNAYLYLKISSQKVTLKKGDALHYDLFLPEDQSEAKGGIDITFADGSNLRDSGAADEDGVPAHPAAPVEDAVGSWCSRTIDLSDLEGRTSEIWDVAFEQDARGVYIFFIANVYIRHKDGSKTVIYDGGTPPEKAVHLSNLYDKDPVVVPVPRAKVKAGAELKKLIEQELNRY